MGLILRVASITLAHALTTMATRTLLFVVGASPQIVTETLYALPAHGVSGGDVHILTTTTGRDAIQKTFRQLRVAARSRAALVQDVPIHS